MGKRKTGRLYKACFIILILGALVCVTAWFALSQEDYRAVDSKNTDPSDLFDMLQNRNGKIELTENYLNGLTSSLLAKPIMKGNIVINGANFYLNDDKITLEVRMKYRGISLVPGITGKLASDGNKVLFNVSSIKLGRLLLPRGLIMEWLKGYSSRDVKIYNNRVEVNKEFIPIDIKSVRSENSKIVIEMMTISEILKIEAPGENYENYSEKSDLTNAEEPVGNERINEENPEKDGIAKQETSGGESASMEESSRGAIKEENAKNASGTGKSGSSSKNNPSGSGKTQNNSPNSQKSASNKGRETADALKKVSVQLGNAAGVLKNSGEKQMIYKIQTVVSRVTENPDYDYKQEALEVMSWYKNLPDGEKTSVKKAIMDNVDASNIMKLLSIFGI